jgi:hypothetical protein
MKLEKLPNGRWAVCEDDGTVLQTWKTERCAQFDLLCYIKGAADLPRSASLAGASSPIDDMRSSR